MVVIELNYYCFVIQMKCCFVIQVVLKNEYNNETGLDFLGLVRMVVIQMKCCFVIQVAMVEHLHNTTKKMTKKKLVTTSPMKMNL